jgi:ribosome-binding protein aMBF1 (putative translation factor)
MVAGTVQLKGKRFVIVAEEDYERLVARRAGEPPLPPLPKPLKNGNYDAIAYARASLARKIIRDRRAAGLSQAELARRAGIRAETLNRIEKLKLTPSVAVVEKLERAFGRT